MRVLIVDDEPVFREAARMVVEMADGFEVAGEAESGDEAIILAKRLRPDLVLIDVKMPGIDGIETTRRIRELEDPPLILVMSTHESGNYKGPALAAGAGGFIPKASLGMDVLEAAWARLTG